MPPVWNKLDVIEIPTPNRKQPIDSVPVDNSSRKKGGAVEVVKRQFCRTDLIPGYTEAL